MMLEALSKAEDYNGERQKWRNSQMTFGSPNWNNL